MSHPAETNQVADCLGVMTIQIKYLVGSLRPPPNKELLVAIVTEIWSVTHHNNETLLERKSLNIFQINL